MIFMKKFKDKLKDKAGFTLVELIVVIAILGILAAVAVPAYTGYVKKANNAKVMSELTTVVTAAQSVAVEKGTSIKQITVASNGTITLTANDATALDAKEMAQFVTNVENGAMKNWTNVLKGSEYEGKSLTWTTSTQEWKAA